MTRGSSVWAFPWRLERSLCHSRVVPGGMYSLKQLMFLSILETETKAHRPKTVGRHDQPFRGLKPQSRLSRGQFLLGIKKILLFVFNSGSSFL